MSGEMDTVFLRRIELFGYIGVLDEEKRTGQTFLIDVEIGTDLRAAGRSDILSQTINYAEVFALAKQLMDEARCDLIETYAEQFAAEIFSYFDLAKRVSVMVRKPDAPIDGTFESAGIRIVRNRDE